MGKPNRKKHQRTLSKQDQAYGFDASDQGMLFFVPPAEPTSDPASEMTPGTASRPGSAQRRRRKKPQDQAEKAATCLGYLDKLLKPKTGAVKAMLTAESELDPIEEKWGELEKLRQKLASLQGQQAAEEAAIAAREAKIDAELESIRESGGLVPPRESLRSSLTPGEFLALRGGGNSLPEQIKDLKQAIARAEQDITFEEVEDARASVRVHQEYCQEIIRAMLALTDPDLSPTRTDWLTVDILSALHRSRTRGFLMREVKPKLQRGELVSLAKLLEGYL